jgi:hypothetical protein
VKTCESCGMDIFEKSDSRVMWKAWAYSHDPLHSTLCVCNGPQMRKSTRTEFPEYPLEDRLRDLRDGRGKTFTNNGEYIN